MAPAGRDPHGRGDGVGDQRTGPGHFAGDSAPELQGRVLTLFGTLATAPTPLGLFAAAPVAELLGVRAWYVAGGVAAVGAAAIARFMPSLLAIEDGRDRSAPPTRAR